MIRAQIVTFVTLFLTGIVFLIGGLGYRVTIVQDLGVFAALILLCLVWLFNKRVVIPTYFWLYLGCVALVGWDLLTRGSSFYSPKFFSLMLSGGLFWLTFHTIKSGQYAHLFLDLFPSLLIVLGYIFFIGSLWYQRGVSDPTLFSFGLLRPLSWEHHHLGVYWGVILVAFIPYFLKTQRYPWYLVLTFLLGTYLVVTSHARSAYLAFFVGGISLFDYVKQKQIFTSKYIGLLLVSLLSILVISAYKPIRSLNFFTPALLTLYREPMGVGIGRFQQVSAYYAYLYRSVDYVTTSAHNLFLEILTGLGILGVFFLAWFALVCKDLFLERRKNVFKALFLAMSAVFFFDPGYAIPLFFWLWMSVLGLAQDAVESD